MKIARLVASSLIASAVLALGIYGVAVVIYRPTGNGFESLTTLGLAIALFASPFVPAAFLALYGRTDEDVAVRTAAFIAAALTTTATCVAEFLTWRAMFFRDVGSSTAPVAFITVPILGVLVTALGFAGGFLIGRWRAHRGRAA